MPSMRRRFVASRSLGPTRSVLRQRGQLMNDVCRMRGLDGRDQGLAIQGVGNGHGGAQRAQVVLLARGPGQRGDLMSRGDERAHEGNADGSRSTCNKDVHDTVFLSRARRIARPEPSASVRASRTAVVAKSGRHCRATWAT